MGYLSSCMQFIKSRIFYHKLMIFGIALYYGGTYGCLYNNYLLFTSNKNMT